MIKSHQPEAWHDGLTQLEAFEDHPQATMWKDFFLLVLFMGLRRMEADSLSWKDVYFKAKTFTVHDN